MSVLTKSLLQKYIQQVLDEDKKKRQVQTNCKIISVDTEQEYEKRKDASGKNIKVPVKKTTKVQSCDLELK